MNLNKLLRKHSRTLLMVFMSLLLVAFLIPNTIQGCGERRQGRAMVRGEAFGESISNMQLESVRAEMRILENFGFKLPISLESSDAALDYYLLGEQAQRMGLRVGREEVLATLKEIGYTDEFMRSRQQAHSRLSYDDIYDMIGRLLSVNRLKLLECSAMYDSLPRQELVYRDGQQQAVAELSVINSRAFLHQVPPPTDEQLVAFFEECKARDTEHTEEELLFGYRLPDRVQIEYLTVDPEKVRKVVTVRGRDARQYFEENAYRYTKPDPLASQPAQGSPPLIQMTYNEAEKQVREDLRTRRAHEAAQSLINDIFSEAHRPWGTAPVREDGFTSQPEGEIVSFEKLREDFSTTYPVELGRTELLELDGLRRVPGLGQASLMDASAPELALRVKGILDRNPGDKLPVINLMEPAPVVLTYDYDPVSRQKRPRQAFLFRVVQVAKKAPPDSFQDVREQLVEDWKLVQAHELARAAAERLATRAREAGLAAAVEDDIDLKAALTAGEQAATQPAERSLIPPDYVKKLEPFSTPLTRNSAQIKFIGPTRGVPKALFELADTSTADTSAAHRVCVVPVVTLSADQHSEAKWVVGELSEVKPLYEGPFKQELVRRVQDTRNWRREIQFVFGQVWSASENVQQRTGFQSTLEPAQPETPQTP
ncbi:MAG: hypothetical protein KAY37_10845 [Phycisphaerae bacterium]|nr:hypothetical protein [Phycisphaerae bacterium]